jgi:hypothetical protein
MSWLQRVAVSAKIPKVDFATLPTLLSWPDDASVQRSISRISLQYLSRVSQALGMAFARIGGSDHPRASVLRELVTDLPDELFFRLVITPEIFSVVAGSSGRSPDELIEFLISSVAAERRRAGEAGSEEVWTALGDARFGDDRVAPRLSGGPPVDADSPSALRLTEPRCGPPLPWTDEGLGEMVGRLSVAFEALESVAPAARRLVRDLTRVVVVRREGLHPDVFRSSSTNGVIGRTLLVNPALESVTTFDLADALVHESIHHALYMGELGSPMVLDPIGCADVRPLSPWTGNPLTVHSYLHACFVWFGLLNLWARPEAESLGAADRVRTMRAGFRRGSLVTPIEEALHCLAPWVPAVLGEIEAATA